MTIVEAYNKYNNLKSWYDERTSTFLDRIAVIDAKIEELKQAALSAVGTTLGAIMKAIKGWIDRIMKIISALQDFIATVEKMVSDWITNKISEITQNITKKITEAAKIKAEGMISATTGIPQIPEVEEPEKIKKIDYMKDYPPMPDMPPNPPKVEVTDLPSMVSKYSPQDMSSLPFQTQNFTLPQYCSSVTARARGISNTPSDEHRANLQALNTNIVDPLVSIVGKGKLGINSGYRSPALNRAIGGAATSQHSKGEAVDLNVVDGNYRRVFKIILTMNFDQLIWEHKSETSRWIHVSYNRNGRNRKQVLDYNGQCYTSIPANRLSTFTNTIPEK